MIAFCTLRDETLCRVTKKPGTIPGFLWSGRLDLNQRPFGPEPNALPNCATPRDGANVGTRTPDLRITSAPLYLLSHIGTADSS